MMGFANADGLVDDGLRHRILSQLVSNEGSAAPPRDRWERRTVDDAQAPQPTWGLRKHVLDSLPGRVPMQEVQARLQRLYPDVCFYHMPAALMSSQPQVLNSRSDGTGSQGQFETTPGVKSTDAPEADSAARDLSGTKRACQQLEQSQVDQQADVGLQQASSRHGPAGAAEQQAVLAECNCFVGNAAVHGDNYAWHVDADPATIPGDSVWAQHFAPAANRVRHLRQATHNLPGLWPNAITCSSISTTHATPSHTTPVSCACCSYAISRCTGESASGCNSPECS
jgi:hypothetical protein